MSGAQSTAELIDALRRVTFEGAGYAVEGPEGIEDMARILSASAHPDFVTVMVPKEGPAVEHPGIDGFREALNDWISPYERFRLMIDEVIPLEDKLVFLARQVGTTKHDEVEVEIESVSVWDVVDGKVRQASFYLDRRAGLEAAGIDPDSR